MSNNHSVIDKCQICGNNVLEQILFLGYVPPVNTMPKIGTMLEEVENYPLELFRCSVCTLVQIGFEVDKKVLFPPEYPYLSGTTKILRENFADLSEEATAMLGLKSDDLIVDIGSNDGTLLSNFKNKNFSVLGVEPSLASEVANKNDIRTLMSFFNLETAVKLRAEYGPAKVITAANVFAHIGDIHSVVDGIVSLLDENGVFISESHYLLSLIETIQYDTIYHEHLRHYSVVSIGKLLSEHGLEIFHVKRIPTHGGSVRVYAARKGQREIDDSVKKIVELEDQYGITSGKALRDFRDRVVKSKIDLLTVIGKIRSEGAKIYGIGAPSRASTLINYVGIDDGLIDCVMEVKNSHKIGKYVPGTKIPVLDEEKLVVDQPEYALLLSWHIADELIANLKNKGYKGKFIVPLPTVKII